MTALADVTHSGAGPGTISVLLAEDDPGVAAQLVRALTRGGYLVDHVATGAAALGRREQPDVVLLDLPDTGGVHVCRQLRQRSDVAEFRAS